MEEKKKLHKIISYILFFSFIAVIILTILPACKKSKDEGPGYSRIQCIHNMKCLALACILYQNEQNSWPDKERWNDLTKSYVGNNDVFQCYIDKVGPCSYAMNENIPAEVNELPGDLVLLFESAPGWNQTGGPDDVVTDRHEKPGANVAFVDGHVEFVKPEDIPIPRWTVDNNEQ